MEVLEFRFLPELRASNDGVLHGIAVRYGDVASIGGYFDERIVPGAFGNIDDVVMNVQHDRARPLARTGGGGLELLDSEDNLKVRATLPDTTDAKDAMTMVRNRVLRGFSVEFRCLDEDFQNNVRTVKRAELVGLAVVDRPAYGDSVAEVAQRMKTLNHTRWPDWWR